MHSALLFHLLVIYLRMHVNFSSVVIAPGVIIPAGGTCQHRCTGAIESDFLSVCAATVVSHGSARAAYSEVPEEMYFISHRESISRFVSAIAKDGGLFVVGNNVMVRPLLPAIDLESRLVQG